MLQIHFPTKVSGLDSQFTLLAFKQTLLCSGYLTSPPFLSPTFFSLSPKNLDFGDLQLTISLSPAHHTPPPDSRESKYSSSFLLQRAFTTTWIRQILVPFAMQRRAFFPWPDSWQFTRSPVGCPAKIHSEFTRTGSPTPAFATGLGSAKFTGAPDQLPFPTYKYLLPSPFPFNFFFFSSPSPPTSIPTTLNHHISTTPHLRSPVRLPFLVYRARYLRSPTNPSTQLNANIFATVNTQFPNVASRSLPRSPPRCHWWQQRRLGAFQ